VLLQAVAKRSVQKAKLAAKKKQKLAAKRANFLATRSVSLATAGDFFYAARIGTMLAQSVDNSI
jgi:hypothetical protein